MKKLMIVFISCAFLLTACVSAGNQALKNETEQSIKSKIIKNKTTKSELKKIIGSPDTISFTNGEKEMWTYNYFDSSADVVNFIPVLNSFGSSSSGVKKELVVIFNDDDVVIRYTMSVSDHSVKTGIFK